MIYGNISSFVISQNFALFREIFAFIISRKFCKIDSSEFCKKRTFLNFLRENEILVNIFAFFSRNFNIYYFAKISLYRFKPKIFALFASKRNLKKCEIFGDQIFPFRWKPYTSWTGKRGKFFTSFFHLKEKNVVWSCEQIEFIIQKSRRWLQKSIKFYLYEGNWKNRGRQFLITRFWKTQRETLTSTFKGPE